MTFSWNHVIIKKKQNKKKEEEKKLNYFAEENICYKGEKIVM